MLNPSGNAARNRLPARFMSGAEGRQDGGPPFREHSPEGVKLSAPWMGGPPSCRKARASVFPAVLREILKAGKAIIRLDDVALEIDGLSEIIRIIHQVEGITDVSLLQLYGQACAPVSRAGPRRQDQIRAGTERAFE